MEQQSRTPGRNGRDVTHFLSVYMSDEITPKIEPADNMRSDDPLEIAEEDTEQTEQTTMSCPCSGCGEEVEEQQEALSCDVCKTWRHRVCGSGMSRPIYRSIAVFFKTGGKFQWVCPCCADPAMSSQEGNKRSGLLVAGGQPSNVQQMESVKNSSSTTTFSAVQPINPNNKKSSKSSTSEEPIIIKYPQEQSIKQNIVSDYSTPKELPMDSTCKQPINHAGIVIESSLSEECTPSRLPHKQTVRWAVVANGTKQGKPKLYNSQGYTYTVRRTKDSVTYWWCSSRQSSSKCPSIVTQRGTVFRLGSLSHNHPCESTTLLSSLINVDKLKMFIEDIKSPAAMVEDTMHSRSMTSSLSSDSILAKLHQEQTLRWEIDPSGSRRGRPKLFNSKGYTYTVRLVTECATYWWCSLRRKGYRCPATVTQRGSVFKPGKVDHNHQSALLSTKTRVEELKEHTGDLTKSSAVVGKDMMDDPTTAIPLPKNQIRTKLSQDQLVKQADVPKSTKRKRRKPADKMPPYVFFSTGQDIDNTENIIEVPQSDETIQDKLPQEQILRWQIVPNGSNRHRPKLYNNQGYAYTVRRATESATYWWCSIRQKVKRCPATVVQTGSVFKPGVMNHNHFPTLNLSRAEAFKEHSVDITKSPAVVVQDVMPTLSSDIYFPKDSVAVKTPESQPVKREIVSSCSKCKRLKSVHNGFSNINSNIYDPVCDNGVVIESSDDHIPSKLSQSQPEKVIFYLNDGQPKEHTETIMELSPSEDPSPVKLPHDLPLGHEAVSKVLRCKQQKPSDKLCSDLFFTIDQPMNSSGSDIEASHSEDAIPSKETQEQTIKWQVVPNGSKQNKPKLYNSQGYTYTVQQATKLVTQWCCSLMKEGNRCPATVTQRGTVFTPGQIKHNHEPLSPSTKIHMEEVKECSGNMSRSPTIVPQRSITLSKEPASLPQGQSVLQAVVTKGSKSRRQRRADKMPPSLFFNADQSVDNAVTIIESSHPNEPISVKLPQEQTLRWQVVPNGSKRNKPKLFNSRGYSYTMRRVSKSVTYWWCSKRQKGNRCFATVRQRGTDFKPGKMDHNHHATILSTKTRVKELRERTGDTIKSATVVFKDIIHTPSIVTSPSKDSVPVCQLVKQEEPVQEGSKCKCLKCPDKISSNLNSNIDQSVDHAEIVIESSSEDRFPTKPSQSQPVKVIFYFDDDDGQPVKDDGTIIESSLSDDSLPGNLPLHKTIKQEDDSIEFKCKHQKPSDEVASNFYSNIYQPVDHTETVVESSLSEAFSPTQLDEEQPVRWEIIPNGTKRGKPKLYNSQGYAYTLRKKGKSATYWWCCLRQKGKRCPATAMQRGTTFKCGLSNHNHPGDPAALLSTRIRVEVFKRCAEEVAKSAAALVRDVMQAQTADSTTLPKPANIARAANRKRKSWKPVCIV
nr:uncharacterized protein LOC123764981 [Procambarus clarkii]